MLAESWEEADGGMSVILHLRDDVTFHDGSTFDADDVIYFFDKGMEGKFATRITPYVASYEKLDQYTVKLTKPNIYTNVLAFLVEHAYIIPKEAHSADPEGFNQHPIGTGPYTFVSEEADGSIILKAYDNYYGEAPVLRTFACSRLSMHLPPSSLWRPAMLTLSLTFRTRSTPSLPETTS